MRKLMISVSLFVAVLAVAFAARREFARTSAFATAAPMAAGQSIIGNICEDSPPGCAYSTESATVHLEPGGRQMLSGYHAYFEFDGVLDGDYTLTIEPACLSAGCYAPLPVTIAGTGANVMLFPDPAALPTDTPIVTDTPTPTDTSTPTATATSTDTPTPTSTATTAPVPTDTPAPNIGCPWDVTGNGVVNSLDLLAVALHFGGRNSGRYFAAYDLNSDGWINSLDLLLTARHYGPCPD